MRHRTSSRVPVASSSLLIEPLIDPVLINHPLGVKVDVIQEVPIEESSGTYHYSTCPAIS
jgi:hypothetical protein